MSGALEHSKTKEMVHCLFVQTDVLTDCVQLDYLMILLDHVS